MTLKQTMNLNELPIINSESGFTNCSLKSNCEFSLICPLSSRVKNIKIPNFTNKPTEDPIILFVSDSLTSLDDTKNSYLNSPSGEFFLKIIDELGISSVPYVYTSLVRCACYSIDGTIEVPDKQIIDLCSQHLWKDLQSYTKLKYIVALGSIASKALLQEPELKFLDCIGNIYPIGLTYRPNDELFLLVTYHPAYIIKTNFSLLKEFKTSLVPLVKLAKLYSGQPLSYKTDILDAYQFKTWCESTKFDYENGLIDSFILDIETEGSYFSKDSKILGFSVAKSTEKVGHFIFYDHSGAKLSPEEKTLIRESLIDLLLHVPVSNHNLKYDLSWICYKFDFPFDKLNAKWDTMIMSFLIFGKSRGGSFSLKYLAETYLGFDGSGWKTEIADFLTMFPPELRSYDNLPKDMIAKYGALDAIISLHLLEFLKPKLYELKLDFVYEEIYRKFLNNVINIEVEGVYIDWDLLKFLKREYTKLLEELHFKISQFDKVVQRYPSGFNINSAKQLIPLIYEDYGYPVLHTTPKGSPSVKDEVLDELYKSYHDKVEPEAANFLLEVRKYRSVSSYLSKFIDKIFEESAPYKDVVTMKPDYSMISVDTGRLGSFFHTLGKHGDAKSVIISKYRDIGGIILSIDYSQIEVRVMAGVANDENMIEAYKNGFDIHTATASKVFKIPYNQVDKTKRNYAKTIVFGILYGKTLKSLIQTLGISEEEGKEYYDMFWKTYPKLKTWIESTHDFASKHGYVRSSFGFIRYLNSINSSEISERNAAKREAQNTVIQSNAAHITIHSLNRIVEKFNYSKLKSRVIGTVHDAISIDVYPTELFQVMKIVKKSCINEAQYSFLNGVPLEIEMSLGASYGELLEIEPIDGDYSHLYITGYTNHLTKLLNLLDKTYKTELLETIEVDSVPARREPFDGILPKEDYRKFKVKINLL